VPTIHHTQAGSSAQEPAQTLAHELFPWLEHPILSGLRERLQLVYDCWSLLKFPGGTSRRPVYLPRGVE